MCGRRLQPASACRGVQDRPVAPPVSGRHRHRPRRLSGRRQRRGQARKRQDAGRADPRRAGRAGRRAPAKRGLAGPGPAAPGRTFPAGCRRRHRQRPLAGAVDRLRHHGQNQRVLSRAACPDRQSAHPCGRGRPRQGAQGPPAGRRSRHEPGALPHRRRLLPAHRPAPDPQGRGTGQICRQGRAAAAHRGPAAELSARRGGNGQPQPDAQHPAAPQGHCRRPAMRGAAGDALQQKAGRVRPETSGRQLRHLGHGPQRADDGPQQQRRQNLPQPRKEQLQPPPADGAAAHRGRGAGRRPNGAGRV